MAHIFEDRIFELSISTGTGDIALAGAVTAYRAFSSVLSIGDTLPYMIEAVDANGKPTGDYEYGLGTYSAANTITRTTVRGSSNAASLVNFAAGTKFVQLAVCAPASAAAKAEWRAIVGAGAGIGANSDITSLLGLTTPLSKSQGGTGTTTGLKIINVVEATPYTTYTSTGAGIPSDNSIPQITEGIELMTVSITPTSATSRLRIEFDGRFGGGSGSSGVAALFQDSIANALVAESNGTYDSANLYPIDLVHEMAAGTTSATTFRVRVGSIASTLYINGSSAERKFGGVSACRLRVTEIAA